MSVSSLKAKSEKEKVSVFALLFYTFLVICSYGVGVAFLFYMVFSKIRADNLEDENWRIYRLLDSEKDVAESREGTSERERAVLYRANFEKSRLKSLVEISQEVFKEDEDLAMIFLTPLLLSLVILYAFLDAATRGPTRPFVPVSPEEQERLNTKEREREREKKDAEWSERERREREARLKEAEECERNQRDARNWSP